MIPHKSPDSYPISEIRYGHCRFGICTYRFLSGKEVDWWIDREVCAPREIMMYEKWLKANDLEDPAPPGVGKP